MNLTTNILKQSLHNYDNHIRKNKYKEIATAELYLNHNDTRLHKLILKDEKKKVIFEGEIEILGFLVFEGKVWKWSWSWSIYNLTRENTNVRLLQKYGMNMELEKDTKILIQCKELFMKSDSIIYSIFQSDSFIGLLSLILKNKNIHCFKFSSASIEKLKTVLYNSSKQFNFNLDKTDAKIFFITK